jgi:hypothetical protein
VTTTPPDPVQLATTRIGAILLLSLETGKPAATPEEVGAIIRALWEESYEQGYGHAIEAAAEALYEVATHRGAGPLLTLTHRRKLDAQGIPLDADQGKASP